LSSMLWHRRGDSADGDATTGGPCDQAECEIELPHRVAARLSQRFPFDEVTRQYFTMVYGLLDTKTHEFTYVSAGHPHILRVRANGEVDMLDALGFPIGVGPGSEYEDCSVSLEPGDRLYIHSDGLTEAMSPGGELFRAERMIDVLRDARDVSLDDSLQKLSAAIRDWTATSERKDDQTVVAIERSGAG